MSSTVTDDIAVAPDDGSVEAPARRYRGGWRIVARKEFADHVHSARFVILIILSDLLPGHMFSDVTSIFGSFDFVMGECDR